MDTDKDKDKNKIPTETKSFTKQQVLDISKDPKNVVYEYEHDLAARVKPVAEVKYLVRETKCVYDDLRRARPESCDNSCRREMMEKSPQLADFSKTHPLFFEKLTNREATVRDFHIMFAHLNLRSQVESGRLSHEEASQQMNLMVMEQCKLGMSYDQWKKENR
jgi:hypothetical protein